MSAQNPWIYALMFINVAANAAEPLAPADDWREQGINLVNNLQAFLKDNISRPEFEKNVAVIKQSFSPVGSSQMQTQLEILKQNIVLEGSSNQATQLPISQAPIEINPGFSCYQASTPSEYAICANPQLSAYDLEMSFLYYKTLAKLKNPNSIKQLQIAQSSWQKSRNTCKDDLICLKSNYQTRIQQLRAEK